MPGRFTAKRTLIAGAGACLLLLAGCGDKPKQKLELPSPDVRVAEVTQGERIVAVTWAQSMVKDAEQRSLLYQLGCAREKLLNKQPNEEHTRQVDLVYVNLVRKWSDL